MPYIQGDGIMVEFDAITDENLTKTQTITSSPIEGGQNISDHAYINPVVLRLQGILVDDAANKKANIDTLWNKKSICTYVGRNWIGNLVITSFTSNHPVDIDAGLSFTLTLQTIKISNTQEFTYVVSVQVAQVTAQVNKQTNVGVNQTTTKQVDQQTYQTVQSKINQAIATSLSSLGKNSGGGGAGGR